MLRLHIFSFFLLFSLSVYSQESFVDSLNIQFGSVGTIATKDYQPLWMVSNKFGVFSDQKSDITSHILIANKHLIGSNGGPFSIRYGIDLYNNKHLNNTFLQEAFLKVDYGSWQLRGGRYKEIIGEVDPDLSSGSLGVSGNALPIPRIGIALTEYKPIPFTNGWLQVKGLISHGWMGNKQYLKDAYLHEKTLYLRAGKGKLKVYGGIQHFAVWGGRREDWISLDRSFKGFLNVLFAREADDGSVYDESVNPDSIKVRPNRAGDHRGVVEGGIQWETDNYAFNFYTQTPFEMGQGITFRNIDRLVGVSITSRGRASFFKKALIEFIYTKQMNDFYKGHYRESYYNNGIYATGWEYNDRIIGTSLFINRQRANKYYPEIVPYDWDADRRSISGNMNIVSNRVIGGHFGALYSIFPSLNAKTMVTYTRNYGTYAKDVFKPGKNQSYTLQEFSYDLPERGVTFTAGLASDLGQLTRNTGFSFGFIWHFSNSTSSF